MIAMYIFLKSAPGLEVLQHFWTKSFQGFTHHDHLSYIRRLNKVKGACVMFSPAMFIIGLHNESLVTSVGGMHNLHRTICPCKSAAPESLTVVIKVEAINSK